MGLGKYLKKAFLNHWNLLAFLGGLGFAALSGQPDVYIPLVLAGEAAYVGLIGTHPKFRYLVDVQEHQASRKQDSEVIGEAFQRILKSLPPRQLRRFEALRDRCTNLRQLARHMKETEDPTGLSTSEAFEDLQLSSLDRLLWIYLRLLYTQTMLERFLESTSEAQIRGDIKKLEDRIAGTWKPGPDATVPPARQNILKTLQDNLETCRARLANLEKAKENYELVDAEIGRLENKIQSITEMAINRQDAQFVAGQVDQVASSLVQTEQAMNDLQFATGLGPLDDAAPAIVPRGPAVPEVSPAEESPPPRPRKRQADDGIRYY
ncbi:hypothetical protein OJF2_53110 [Aquisphaera giovannonii]|uniref:Uncharacterized protein n=1 Tax=Aquisphaera giovannonii TaxID=406548 RepID=A0A5B9W7R5_9BACT|nr:hypothetical protein [Aquisphaera giovannonii]QEH36726.1 hypothetical protein OJF2_53110 [Aquisphaera giovannonii]